MNWTFSKPDPKADARAKVYLSYADGTYTGVQLETTCNVGGQYDDARRAEVEALITTAPALLLSLECAVGILKLCLRQMADVHAASLTSTMTEMQIETATLLVNKAKGIKS